MYLTRTRPMMRDKKVDAISTTVAVKRYARARGAATRGRATNAIGNLRP